MGWLLQVSERLCCNVISPVPWHAFLTDRPAKLITEAGEKAEAFNVLFNSLFVRDIRCEGFGTVPSFDESKESQNGKRVKKCFEERELFVSGVLGTEGTGRCHRGGESPLLLFSNYGAKEKSLGIKICKILWPA